MFKDFKIKREINESSKIIKEEWKIFNNDYHQYECSNLGRFRRKIKKGYRYLKIYSDNRRKSLKIVKVTLSKYKSKEFNAYKIMAEMFLRPLKENEVCIPKNNNREDLRVSNLFIITKSQLGKITGYKTSQTRKIIYTDNLGYKTTYRSARQAGIELGTSYQTVLDICNGKRKKPKFNIRFKEE